MIDEDGSMPTNLPPEYFEVEKRYKAAKTNEERIVLLEELISTIPKHKGTDKLRADLRRRLSKLRSSTQTQKGAGRRESVYHIDREGAGQVAIVGAANVGKSALVAALTNARPEVADYPFATRIPTPGMMLIDNVQVQLIDTPSLRSDYVEPQVMELIRRADLILLLVDLQAYPIEQLEESIALLEQYRIIPAHHEARYPDPSRLTFVPLLVMANKNDDEQTDGDYEALCELLEGEWPIMPLSVLTGRHVDEMKWTVFRELNIMRVYSKPPGKEPDYTSPFVMQRGSTVEEFAGEIHQDFYRNMKSARVWGSAVHDGQMVGRDHVLDDGDVVELRM
jgi:ribosome-interacting GTPase 1